MPSERSSLYYNNDDNYDNYYLHECILMFDVSFGAKFIPMCLPRELVSVVIMMMLMPSGTEYIQFNSINIYFHVVEATSRKPKLVVDVPNNIEQN